MRRFTLRGSITPDGTCKGAQYSNSYGTWDDVVVQATVKLTVIITHKQETIKYTSNQVLSVS